MKQYLAPQIERRGQPVLMFIKKDAPDHYWLGCYHDIIPLKRRSRYDGEGWEYNQVSEERISKNAFDALKEDAKKAYARVGEGVTK